MATEVLKIKPNFVEWSISNVFSNFISPMFCSQNAKFYMKYENTSTDICLELHSFEKSVLHRPFNVSVRVYSILYVCKSATGMKMRKLCIKKPKVTLALDARIWQWSREEIFKISPLFYTGDGLMFRVTIEDECLNFRAGKNVRYKVNATVHPSSYSNANPKSCLDSLLEDLTKLLNGYSVPDVELHCEGHTIKAHKTILSMRSPVLAKILHSGDMVEGCTDVLEVKDMAADTFQQFIRYLYTIKLDVLNCNTAMLLYEVGVRYDVNGLARRCSQFLIENLTVENVFDVLVVADDHSDLSFKKAVIANILKKNIPLSGYCWQAICKNRPILATEVLNCFSELYEKNEYGYHKNLYTSLYL